VAGIIVIGASAGGFHALMTLVSGLPADLPTPVAVVLHIGSHRSQLAEILHRRSPLEVAWATDGMPLRPKTIHVAPPDHHLEVDGAVLRTTRGPRENLARPAIDPLFRSAARSFGPGAIGVILTGRLDDGTAGLHEIKRLGGIAVVQNPDTAEQPSMPRSALKYVDVDHVSEVKDMSTLLANLASAISVSGPTGAAVPEPEPPRVFGPPVAFTCPDCGGALRREDVGGALLAYACHTGHRVTGQTLAAQQLQQVEHNIESTIRLLHEAEALAKDFQATASDSGDLATAKSWQQLETRFRDAMERVLILGASLPRPAQVELEK